MTMTEEEIKNAYQDIIDGYVGYEIDWTSPPGEAAIVLESLIANHSPGDDNILSESIDDLSQSFGNKKDFYESVMKPLHNIRRFKW
jgi:hypothetical protein